MAARYFDEYAVILGAGASLGASVGQTTPPLDAEFLAVAHRVLFLGKRKKRDPDKSAWNRLCKALKTAGIRGFDPAEYRLEQLSTYLEARANMPSLQHKAGKPADYEKALEELAHVICRTLVKTNGTKPCPLHRALFDLVNPACVVTFNYDLIADQTLFSMNRLSWTRLSYAGTSLNISPPGGTPYTRQVPDKRPHNAIPYLKLHGSINWQSHKKRGGFSLTLSEMPGTRLELPYADPPTDPMVVPPVAAKVDIRSGAVRDLWKSAAASLRTAPGWIIWGYSFPPTDTVTQVLCRTALGKNTKPKPVIVINPDFEVSSRVKRLLNNVRIKNQWSSVERFLFDANKLRVQ